MKGEEKARGLALFLSILNYSYFSSLYEQCVCTDRLFNKIYTMPREQAQWFMKESIHDNAKQSCTYYSIVNVNKNNYPYLSSYEQEQTWTLTRSMSNNHKRYQSSIENIHLTLPKSSTKHVDYENVKIKKERSHSVLPLGLSAQRYTSSTSLYPSSSKKMNSIDHQDKQKTLPIKAIRNEKSNKKNEPSVVKKSRPFSKPMRVIHSNGEFVVRI